MVSRASAIFIVQPGWCSLPKLFLSFCQCSSGITEQRLRLIFQISTCVIQNSGIKLRPCLKPFCSVLVVQAAHICSQEGAQSFIISAHLNSCTKPIITFCIYIIGKNRMQQAFFPFFLYFYIFFPLGKVYSLRFVENRCDPALMHSDFIAYWNICITLNLENKLKLLMDFE